MPSLGDLTAAAYPLGRTGDGVQVGVAAPGDIPGIGAGPGGIPMVRGAIPAGGHRHLGLP
jgi:hypothetical protein